jgi:hypothetical protein
MREARKAFLRAFVALVALVCASLSLSLAAPLRLARADVRGPEDDACLELKEGDVCDERNELQGGPGYRGVCERIHFGEGRSRLRCRLPDVEPPPLQEACIAEPEGGECYRPSGAPGRCFRIGSRTVPAFGGASTVELPILECRHVPEDTTAETRAGIALIGGSAVACAIFVVVLRRRRRGAERRAAEIEQGGQADKGEGDKG